MESSDKYRRKEDEAKLLILVNERVGKLQTDLKELLDERKILPCSTHELRLKILEKITWGAVTAIVLLIIESIASIFGVR